MTRIALYAVTVLVTGLLFTRALWAAPIPQELRAFLESRGRHDLVARYEAMPVLTPEQVAERFNSARQQRVLGAGFYGLVFVDADDNVIKLSHPITAALGKAVLRVDGNHPGDAFMATLERRYASLLQNTAFDGLDVSAHNGVQGEVGTQFTRDEVYSKFVAAVFLPKVHLPSFVSSDGLVFGMDKAPGIPLKKILQSQREGTELHRRYDMELLWQEVVHLLRLTEAMLKQSGMTIDTFQPANILVDLTEVDGQQHITLHTLDEAIAVLTPEARETLARKNIHIPQPAMPEFFRFVPWPAITTHLVYNVLWDLDYEQALRFLMTYHGVEDRQVAVRALAAIEPLTIVEYPPLAVTTNIERARAELRGMEHRTATSRRGILRRIARRCRDLLTGF